MKSFSIDYDRLRTDIEETAKFGALTDRDGHGRTVLTGTEANRHARDRLVDTLEAAGASVRIDSVGNIAGRWAPDGVNSDAAPVVIGSHLDSVPEGGIFDGVLGVYAGVETIRTLQENDLSLKQPIEVVSFTEEEGARFGDGVLGSSVAADETSAEEALSYTDNNGVNLKEALENIGYHGEGSLDADEWNSFFELHVEQASKLENANRPVGVVSTIAGIVHGEVDVEGHTNHAGSTPMYERKDALTAASEIILSLEAIATNIDEGDGTSVGTVGKLDVSPNVSNVIPGSVSFSLDIRDVSEEGIEAILDELNSELDNLEGERHITTSLKRTFSKNPTDMSARLRQQLFEASERLGFEALDLHSGAFHDTMNISLVTDAVLLFVRSRDGISHSPMEWTDWKDCGIATNVLANAVAETAK